MADEEKKEDEAKETDKSSKSSPVKLIIIIFVLLLALGGAGVFVFLKFIVPAMGGGGAENAAKVEKKEVVIEKDEDGIGIMYPLETFIVNLASSGGRRFLKVNMELELSSEALKAEMDKRRSQIRDSVITVLSNKSFDDVYSVSGKVMIRAELTRRINLLLKNGSIMNIYFTEFVIQ